MSRVVVLRQVRFSRLQKLTGVSGGNLASHLQVLEQAGLVRLRRGFLDKTLGKYAVVSPEGIAAFQDYVIKLERVLRQLKTDAAAEARADDA